MATRQTDGEETDVTQHRCSTIGYRAWLCGNDNNNSCPIRDRRDL